MENELVIYVKIIPIYFQLSWPAYTLARILSVIIMAMVVEGAFTNFYMNVCCIHFYTDTSTIFMISVFVQSVLQQHIVVASRIFSVETPLPIISLHTPPPFLH